MKLKYILVISYHYFPQNNIASKRPQGWAKYLKKFGYHPIILTHRYELNKEGNWKTHSADDKEIVEKNDSHTIIRIPRWEHPNHFIHNILKNVNITRKLFVLYHYLIGNTEIETLSSRYSFKKFLKKNKSRFSHCSCIISIYSPNFALELGKYLHDKLDIPLIFDLRDYYLNKYIHNKSKNIKESVQKKLLNQHWSRWFRSACCFTTVSEGIRKKVANEFGKEGYIIYNGFDPELFIGEVSFPMKMFTISHVGSLHPEISFSALFEGVTEYIEENPWEPIYFQLIGPKREAEWEDYLSKKLSKESFSVTKKIDHVRAVHLMRNSHILLKPNWKRRGGVLSGKIFEYLAAKRPILVAPKGNHEMEELIEKCMAGKILKDKNEVKDTLSSMFAQWKKHGMLVYQGKDDVIQSYSKVAQAKVLASLLDRIVDSSMR